MVLKVKISQSSPKPRQIQSSPHVTMQLAQMPTWQPIKGQLLCKVSENPFITRQVTNRFFFSLLAVTDQSSQIHQNLKNSHETLTQFRTNSASICTNSSNSPSNPIPSNKQRRNASKFDAISSDPQKFTVNLHHWILAPAIQTRARHRR